MKELDLNIILEQIENYCATDLGKNLLRQTKVSYDRLIIKQYNRLIKDALACTYRFSALPIKGINDINNILNSALKERTLNINECILVIKHLQGVKEIIDFSNSLDIRYEEIDNLISCLTYDLALHQNLSEFFDLQGNIKDHATAELAKVRQDLRNLENNLQEIITNFISVNSKYLMDSIVTIRNDRYVVLVKSSEKHRFKGFIHGESASGLATYVEPQIFVKYNNQKELLQSNEEIEMMKILRCATLMIKEDANNLLANLQTISILDVLFAKARWGKERNCIVANLNDEKNLFLNKISHPLIDPKKVVSNSYRLDDKKHILMITGPNTGGKTVSLKVIGLSVLMTYLGIPVIAEAAEIPFVDRVFVDIGDEQSIVESLSTFSAHLTKIKYILDHATSNSLILVDELGAGTDPKEGEALAIAILQELRSRLCLCVATTHYGQLKKYGARHDDILVASVSFDLDNMIPTYKFIEGISGHSNALDIAARYNIMPSVIHEARKIVHDSQNDEDYLMEKLEKEIQENQKYALKLQEKEKLIAEKTALLEKQEKELTLKKEKILQEAYDEAEIYKLKALDKAEEIIDELLRKKEELKINQVIKLKENLKDEQLKEHIAIKKAFEVGDFVTIDGSAQIAEIVSIKKKECTLNLNGMTVKAKLNRLRHSDKKLVKQKPKITISRPIKRNVSLECNLIGMRVLDGLEVMSKYLDDVKAQGLKSCRIIHGDGTGKLRKAVHEALSKDSSVAEYRLGTMSEGSTGATVVTLK